MLAENLESREVLRRFLPLLGAAAIWRGRSDDLLSRSADWTSPGRKDRAVIFGESSRSARDADAGVMLNHSLEWVASFDYGFDHVPGIRRFELD